MDYNVWFVVGDSSVSLHLLIPQYGYLAFIIIIIIIIIITLQFRPFYLTGHVSELLQLQIKLN